MRYAKVDVKYKRPLVGRYNKSVSYCLECGFEFVKNKAHGSLFDNMTGFNESNIGLVVMWECPVCFSKWFYHGDEHYEYFLDSVEAGTNKYFKDK